jgi:hypothetical protein
MTKQLYVGEQDKLAIANISESVYKVKSQNDNGDYDVSSTDLLGVCSCPDHTCRSVKCKHIFTVEISFALHKEVEGARIEPLVSCTPCIIKNGLGHRRHEWSTGNNQ